MNLGPFEGLVSMDLGMYTSPWEDLYDLSLT